MKENKRTVAFQVSTELFEQFKDYLNRKGIKQNAFFLNCIRQALEEAEQEAGGEADQEAGGEAGQEPGAE